MAERTVCSCGAQIEEVIKSSLSPGKFWQRVGTCEVCIDNHWHEPAAAPTPVELPDMICDFCFEVKPIVLEDNAGKLTCQECLNKRGPARPAAPAESQGVERAQPVEGPRPITPNLYLDEPEMVDALRSKGYQVPAPVEGVERVTDDAPARVEPTRVPDIVCAHCGARYIRLIDGKWQAWTIDSYDPICYANHKTGEHAPVAQPAKHTDNRPAETIPDPITSEWYAHQIAIVNRKNARAETRIEVLEAALRDAREELLVTYDPHTVLRKIDAALAAPSGDKEKTK